MGTVVLHAGMGKAGSTSIQAWLAENAARLRGLETCLLVLRESDERTGARPRLTPYASGNANSNLIRMALTPGGGEEEAYLDSFFEQLGAATTFVRSTPLWRRDGVSGASAAVSHPLSSSIPSRGHTTTSRPTSPSVGTLRPCPSSPGPSAPISWTEGTPQSTSRDDSSTASKPMRGPKRGSGRTWASRWK